MAAPQRPRPAPCRLRPHRHRGIHHPRNKRPADPHALPAPTSLHPCDLRRSWALRLDKARDRSPLAETVDRIRRRLHRSIRNHRPEPTRAPPAHRTSTQHPALHPARTTRPHTAPSRLQRNGAESPASPTPRDLDRQHPRQLPLRPRRPPLRTPGRITRIPRGSKTVRSQRPRRRHLPTHGTRRKAEDPRPMVGAHRHLPVSERSGEIPDRTSLLALLSALDRSGPLFTPSLTPQCSGNDHHRREIQQRHRPMPSMRHRENHDQAPADNSQSARLVKPTITPSIQY